jgi:hypothetical protein
MPDEVRGPWGREKDARIAEKVFGWTRHANGRTTEVGEARVDWCFAWVPERFNGDVTHRHRLPHFSRSADADYSVLERVRDSWDGARLAHFGRALSALWAQDSDMATAGLDALSYRVGDYSRAALAALEVEARAT